jgi:hypothetical protein
MGTATDTPISASCFANEAVMTAETTFYRDLALVFGAAS